MELEINWDVFTVIYNLHQVDMILTNENFVLKIFDIKNSSNFDEIIIILIMIYYYNFLKMEQLFEQCK